MAEATSGPQLDHLQQWYVVLWGVAHGSAAHACLNRFGIVVDVVNDWIALNDTDNVIEAFDTAVEVLKDAATARPRS